jgi:hypothetical protein
MLFILGPGMVNAAEMGRQLDLTNFAHLEWTWAIALGYAASIWAHLVVNSHLM